MSIGEQDIDAFKKMLYCVLTKSQDIPSEDLLARLGDYLWFNVNVFYTCCKFSAENMQSITKRFN